MTTTITDEITDCTCGCPAQGEGDAQVTERTATITLPARDAAEVLRNRIAQTASRLPGNVGVDYPEETLQLLTLLRTDVDQYTRLLTAGGEREGIDRPGMTVLGQETES